MNNDYFPISHYLSKVKKHVDCAQKGHETVDFAECCLCPSFIQEKWTTYIHCKVLGYRGDRTIAYGSILFICPLCGKRHYDLFYAKNCIREHLIEKNLLIATDEKNPTWRRHLAIYRIYRYLDEPPQNIASRLGWFDKRGYGQADRVRKIIGRVFSVLCVSDEKCVFKELLEKVN